MPKPRICLNMIVKDESHVIERCLASVKPHIDAWAIVDTGSRDRTQEKIRASLAGIPGELNERPWVDFAHNRNEALRLAERWGDYVLLIDADDVLETDPSLDLRRLSADAYRIEFVHGDTSYFRESLVRLGRGWAWKGVLHEALYGPPGLHTEVLRGMRIRETREGARSQRSSAEKYGRDAEILRAALEQEPDNTRYAFYLAQSLRDAGLPEEARAAYHHRVGMDGWDQEVFHAKLQIALLLEREGASQAEVVDAYLEAHQYRPIRAEPLCYLARYLRGAEKYVLARLFARAAAEISRPDDVLFVDASVYEWRTRDELAVASYWTHERGVSARLCRELLEDPRLPADQRDRVRQNLQFATT